MVKRKTIPAVLASAVSMSLLFSGCTTSNSNEGNKETSAPSTVQATPGASTKTLAPYKLSMYIPAAGAPADLKLVNEEISNYLKEKINATFELNVLAWADWQDKMNLKFASSDAFDLIWTVAWDNFTTKIQQGSLIDMTVLIDKFAPDAKKIINPALLEGSKINGKNYSLPVNKELGSQRGIMLRKDLVEKYKIDITQIKSVTDLEPVFQMIKEKEPKVTPLYINKDTNVVYTMNVANFDGNLMRSATDYKVVNMLETPEYRKSLDLARKWYVSGYVNKDAATLTDMMSGLKSGKAFSFFEWLKPGKDAEVSTSIGVDWVQVPLTQPLIATSDTTGSMVSISRTSKDPERAAMFLNLLYTDKKLLNMLAFGIEGKHYAKVEGKNDVIDFPKGVTAQTSGYNLNQGYMFGNQFNDYLWANEDPAKWEKFKSFNEKAETSRLLGYNFDQSSVKNEMAAITNVKKEFEPGLVTGTLDPNEILPKYIEKAKSVGQDKVYAEQQKQIDEWVKTKGKK